MMTEAAVSRRRLLRSLRRMPLALSHRRTRWQYAAQRQVKVRPEPAPRPDTRPVALLAPRQGPVRRFVGFFRRIMGG